MSIASALTTLQGYVSTLSTIRTAIRAALVTKGITAASSHDYVDFEADILAIVQSLNLTTGSATPTTTSTTYTPSGYDGYSQFTVDATPLESQSVTPSSSSQTVTPSSGYVGLSSVTVAAAPVTTLSVTPTASAQTFTPSSSYVGYSTVTVSAASLTTLSVTPTDSSQSFTPSSSYVGYSSVTVAAAPTTTVTVTPSTSAQTLTPGSSYVGYSTVYVSAALLESVTVTLTSSSQTITPSSGYYGLSSVVVPAATTLPINGSLIEVTCSSNIDTVTCTVNGNTYTANLDTSTHIAYVTIPYTDTDSAAQTATLIGYYSGTQVASNTVSMSVGIGYYTATLSTSSVIYDSGTWDSYTMSNFVEVQLAYLSELASYLQLMTEGPTSGAYGYGYMYPSISPGNYTQIKITRNSYSLYSAYTAEFGVSAATTTLPSSWETLVSGAETTYAIPSSLLGQPLYFWFRTTGPENQSINVINARITKIEFA